MLKFAPYGVMLIWDCLNNTKRTENVTLHDIGKI